MEKTRVRFAPSPTGLLHLGNVRTALFNWLFARNRGGSFVLRIDDTDAARSTERAELGIYISLKWLGLDWDEGPRSFQQFSEPGAGDVGPYKQSERLVLYARHLEKLREAGRAYPCFCTPQEIEQERREMARQGMPYRYSGKCACLGEDEVKECMERSGEPSWRFKVGGGEVSWTEDARGAITWAAPQIGDFVIQRATGMPTYNFASAVDDQLMGITHVIRGDDHLTNTARQIMICEALGWEPPQYVHLPLITGPDHRPLSKRHGVGSLDDLYADGCIPEAIVNYLALLGWSPPSGNEIMSIEELKAEFDLGRLNKSPAVFDKDKLAWINGKHLRALGSEELFARAEPYLLHAGLPLDEKPRSWLIEALETARERLELLADAIHPMRIYLSRPEDFTPEAREYLDRDYAPELLRFIAGRLGAAEQLNADRAKELVVGAGRDKGIKGKALFMPLRAALTGTLEGPPLMPIIAVLGKEESVKRIEAALAGL